jgi:hypothetical protein
MRTFAQAQDQVQRQASPSLVRLNAVSFSGPDHLTQPILELQRAFGRCMAGTMDTYLFLEDRPEGSRASLGGDYTVKEWEKLLVDEPNEHAGGKRP